MPKSAKLGDKQTAHHDESGPTRSGSNGFDGKKLQGFIDRVEACRSEIDSIMDDAKEACAPHRDDMVAIKKEAAEAGFSKTEFATVLRKRRIEKKVETIDAKLDEDQKETFAQMLHALGALRDTPLGKAAAAAHAGLN